MEALGWHNRWMTAAKDKATVPSTIQETLNVCDGSYYPVLSKAVSLLAVAPVTSCEAERAFSAMKLIKSKNRATMTGKRLNSLMILKIHNDMDIDISSIKGLLLPTKFNA